MQLQLGPRLRVLACNQQVWRFRRHIQLLALERKQCLVRRIAPGLRYRCKESRLLRASKPRQRKYLGRQRRLCPLFHQQVTRQGPWTWLHSIGERACGYLLHSLRSLVRPMSALTQARFAPFADRTCLVVAYLVAGPPRKQTQVFDRPLWPHDYRSKPLSHGYSSFAIVFENPRNQQMPA